MDLFTWMSAWKRNNRILMTCGINGKFLMRVVAWVSWAIIAQNQKILAGDWLEPSRGQPRKPAQGN